MKKLSLFLAILLILLSCKKEKQKPNEIKYYPIPIETWAYINLPLGACYIYKDSATGVLDSVIVTNSTVRYREPVYTINLNGGSSLSSYSDTYELTLEKVDAAGNRTTWLKAKTKIEAGFLIEELGPPIFYNYISNYSGPYSSEKITSILIEGNSYSDIWAIGIMSVPHTWWAKGTGIIKKTSNNGGTRTSFLLRKK